MSYSQNQLLTHGSFLCPSTHLSFTVVTASKESSLVYGLDLGIDAPVTLHPQEGGSRKDSAILENGYRTIWAEYSKGLNMPHYSL